MTRQYADLQKIGLGHEAQGGKGPEGVGQVLAVAGVTLVRAVLTLPAIGWPLTCSIAQCIAAALDHRTLCFACLANFCVSDVRSQQHFANVLSS